MKKLSTLLVALVFVGATTGICLAQATPVVPATAPVVKAVEPAKKERVEAKKVERKSKRKSSHKSMK